jgi:serine/threonine protein kinase/WD40 repeat protein
MDRNEATVAAAVRKQLQRHAGEGRLRPQSHYARLFPGFEAVVEREYAAIAPRVDGAVAPRADGPRDGAPPDDDALDGVSTAPPSSGDGERIGPYRIVKELGRGAQGGVFLAEDTRLPRRVALKVLAPGLVGSGQMRARFRREATAVAKLDHPGICTVYEAEVDGATPFIAMRLVEGRTLAQLIEASGAAGLTTGAARTSVAQVPGTDGAAAPATQRNGERQDVVRLMRLFERIARALHVAHDAGLVHRDVKPANVMVTDGGEPVVLDFGLASDRDENAHLTATGTLMGTPAYMSPEQLALGRVPLDRRTDVYSLGVALYEAFALRHPFHAATREALYHQILNEEPQRLRRVNPALPRDLEVVVETAMSKNRERRYQTALDLAEDLRRVREHEPIRARPAGPVTRVVRWAQRHPAVAGMLGALIGTLGAGLGVSFGLLQQARFEAGEKTKALALADAETAKKVAALNDALAARDEARAAAKRADGLRLAALVPSLLDESPAIALRTALLAADRTDAYQVRDAAFQALDDYVPAAELWGHATYVERVEASPDGTRVASVEEQHPAVILWDPVAASLVARLDAHRDAVRIARFSPDSRLVVTCGDGGDVRLWDARTGARLRELPGHTAEVLAAEFSADASRLATSDASGRAIVWDVAKGAEIHRLEFAGAAPSLDLSPDGARIVVAGLGKGAPAKVLDATTGAAVAEIGAAPGESFLFARFGPDAGRVFVAGDGGSLVWSADGGAVRVERTLVASRVKPSADRRGVFLGTSKEAPVKGSCVVDLEKRALVGPVTPGFRVGALDATGRTVVLADGKRATVRDTATGRELAPLAGHSYEVNDVAFLPDGLHVASAASDFTVRVWDLRERLEFRDVNLARPPRVKVMRWGPDGTMVAWCRRDDATGADTDVETVDAATGRVLARVGGSSAVRTVQFSPRCRYIAVHAADGAVVRDARTGEKVCDLPVNDDAKEAGHEAYWSDDEAHVVVCTTEGGPLHAAVVDVPSGRVAATLPPQLFDVKALAPGGARVFCVLAERNNGAIFDARTGESFEATGHSGTIVEARFSSDGTRALTQAVDTSLRVWDAATAKCVQVIRAGPMLARGCRFSVDGRLARGVENRIVEIEAARPWGRVRLRDPQWELKEFLPDGERLLFVHRDTGDLRSLPLDPIAWARAHAPPELDGNHMIVVDLVSVPDSTAYELDWLERHFCPKTLLAHAANERRAGHFDASLALSKRVLDACPRDPDAQLQRACGLAGRSALPAATDEDRRAREDDAERAEDAVAAYLAEIPGAGRAIAAAPPFAPLRGRKRFDELTQAVPRR